MTIVNCQYCNKEIEKRECDIVRANKEGYKLFCDLTCAGLSHRVERTKEEKKLLKREYDIKFRAERAETIKAKKAEYFKRTYNPEKAAIGRKERMPKHVEYCRRPEYKAWKKEYDQTFRAKKTYGEFWEAAIILFELEANIDNKLAKKDNNLINKSLKRKRLWKQMQNYLPRI